MHNAKYYCAENDKHLKKFRAHPKTWARSSGAEMYRHFCVPSAKSVRLKIHGTLL